METPENWFLIAWVVCSCICIAICIALIASADTRREVEEAWMGILLLSTPISVFVAGGLIIISVLALIAFGPAWLISTFKNLDE